MEQEVIQEAVGSQDQIWAAYGGTNFITFHPDGRFEVTPVVMTEERRQEIESHLMLFFTRFSRIAEIVAARKIRNLSSRQKQLQTMRQMAEEAKDILQTPDRPIREIGGLLREAWCIKKELADGVTTPAVDEIHDVVLRAGALGAKALGASGGGCVLVIAARDRVDTVRDAVGSLGEILPFAVDERGVQQCP